MNDALRLGAILAASLIALLLAQRLADRRAVRRLDRAAARHGLAPRTLPPAAELRAELPFLASLGETTPVAIRSGSIRGGEAHLVLLRAPAGPALGYTLLARRVAAWSARAVVRPESLKLGPAPGGPDPRRLAALAGPELVAALAEAGAWLHVEGPWRVVGLPELTRAATVERLAALSATLESLAPEPNEFAGGLEWNV